MTDDRFSKVDILIQQKKYVEAERILKDLLAHDANNIHFMVLLAEVNLQQDKVEMASKIIDNAIGISPDDPYLFYTKARIALHVEKYDEAEQTINQSIAIDPYHADFFALSATIKLSRKRYEDALIQANRALEMDAENLLALNTRSTALLKLNRKDESFNTIEGALREDPTNAYTHANYGWGLLEKGDHKKALNHFKEALKNDPNFAYAQQGMLEALKADNFIYKLFLKYAFWIGNLTAKYQWGVIVGFYVGFRILKTIAQKNEALQPYLTPLIVILALLAFSTWVITPISNLFLRFNPYGKFLLDKKEKMSSNFVASSFIVFLAGLILFFVIGDDKFLPIAFFGFAMMVPFSVMFSPSKYKYSLLIYAATMSLIGIVAIWISLSTGKVLSGWSTVFLFGFIAFQWVANFLLIKEDNK